MFLRSEMSIERHSNIKNRSLRATYCINESTGTSGEGEGAWDGLPDMLGSVYYIAYLLGAKESLQQAMIGPSDYTIPQRRLIL